MYNNWQIFDGYKNITLTDEIKNKLVKYYELLIQENNKYNLTSITEINDVFEKHFLDSLLFLEEFKITNQSIVDIGTGAGFPGIVIKIFFPDVELVLVESNNKKINFLKLISNELDLKNVSFINQRAEEFSVENKEKYDIVISRAVAYLDIILEIGVQLLKVGGTFILLKGPRADEELANLKGREIKMGLNFVNQQILADTGFGKRVNLFFNKEKQTPNIYPRKYSVIKKESENR